MNEVLFVFTWNRFFLINHCFIIQSSSTVIRNSFLSSFFLCGSVDSVSRQGHSFCLICIFLSLRKWVNSYYILFLGEDQPERRGKCINGSSKYEHVAKCKVKRHVNVLVHTLHLFQCEGNVVTLSIFPETML